MPTRLYCNHRVSQSRDKSREFSHRCATVEIDLPPIATAADTVKAAAAIVEAVAAGEFTPEEAQAVASMVEIQRRAMETQDRAERSAALGAKAGQ